MASNVPSFTLSVVADSQGGSVTDTSPAVTAFHSSPTRIRVRHYDAGNTGLRASLQQTIKCRGSYEVA